MELTTLTIDLEAIASNAKAVIAAADGADVMAVVKANAYNHGARRVAPVLERAGIAVFGVATIPEALAVREVTELPVLAWIWHPEQDLPTADEHIDLGVASMGQARALAADPTPRNVSLVIDTGLNRSGVDEEDWRELFTFIAGVPQLTVTGVFTHLACADDVSSEMTADQVETLERAITVAKECGLNPTRNHASNSPGVMSKANLGFPIVRPGLVLYGYNPFPADGTPTAQGPVEELRPAMTWSATVTVVKKIRAGEGSSYGMTWHAPTDRYTAIVPAGYADGLPRRMQGKLEVAINGKRYPQVGRVCMDQIVVDLGPGEPEVSPGDVAYLFGPGDHGEMTVDEWAAALDTINYEVLCSPRGRVVRTYSGHADEN